MAKVPDHVEFVQQQSTDKIGDLFIESRGFCLQILLFFAPLTV